MKNKALLIATILLFSAPYLLSTSIGNINISEPTDQRENQDYPVKTELNSGITTIRNPDFPKFGRFELVLSHELTIGDKSSEQNYVIGKARGIKVDDEGNIYISDYTDTNIKAFSSKGNLLRTIGQPGQGPGDLNSPFFFVVFPKGNIAVYDMFRSYVSFFDNKGTYVSGFKIEDYFRCSDFSQSQEWLFFETRLWPEIKVDGQFVAEEVNKIIFRTDLKGNSRLTYGKFRGSIIPTKTNNQSGTVTTKMPRGSYTSAWGVDKTGRLFIGYNKDFKIAVYDDKGTILFRFERDFSPRVIPDNIENQWGEKYFPAYEFFGSRDFVFDDEGNLWLRQPWTKKDKYREYNVFSPSGIYLKQIVIPHQIYQIKKNKVYCLLKSEEDLDIIMRVGIEGELKLSR